MAVEYKRELQAVTVANQLVTAEYDDTFLVDGEVKAVAQDQDVFDLTPPVFVEENGKLRLEGNFPKGSDLSLDIGGEHFHVQLTEDTPHYQVVNALPLTDNMTYLVDSVSNADDTDFYTVFTFQTLADPDADPVDMTVSGVTLSAPVVTLPDEVKAMLQGVLS
jgi:hypothetical protein